jgi:chaperonin GroES
MAAAKTMTPAIRPIDDRILLERVDREDQTPGGIYLPDQAKQKSVKARVLRLGPGKFIADGPLAGKRIEIPCSVGDIVLIARYAGSEAGDTYEEREKLLLVRHEDILAILEE